MKNMMRTFGMVIAVAAFTLAFTTTSFANGEKNPNTSSIELKFIGNYENQPVFPTEPEQCTEEEYTITFRDDFGNVLYAAKVKGSNISKKFMLNTDEIGNNALNVEVKAKKNDKSEVYKIDRISNVIEETTVSKIK